MVYRLGRQSHITALGPINLTVTPGEFLAVVGPSGCGKSTLIRLCAGLEEPTEGVVSLGSQSPKDVAAEHRLGVAFQDHALLPWLTARENVAIAYRAAGLAVEDERVGEFLRLVGLEDFAHIRPSRLSGGMRQRVSLARTLVRTPDVLLLDEPFGSLDAVTRRRLNLALQMLWLDHRPTTLLVTHALDEAVFLADRVLVLTAHPGTTRAELRVDLPRPRTLPTTRSPEFHAITDALSVMIDEVADDSS